MLNYTESESLSCKFYRGQSMLSLLFMHVSQLILGEKKRPAPQVPPSKKMNDKPINSSPSTNLTPVPLPQPQPIRVDVRHNPRLATILRDPEPQHQLILTDQFVQKQQRRLIAPRRRQLKRPHQTPRQRPDRIPRGRSAQAIRIDAEHVDLPLALGKVGRPRLKVELEAERARATAGEAGEGDDEVLLVGVACILGDVKGEGNVSGAAGLGMGVGFAPRRDAARAV